MITSLFYSLVFFIVLFLFLKKLSGQCKFIQDNISHIFTITFCFVALNIATYTLTDVLEKVTRPEIIGNESFNQLIEFKTFLSHFMMAYFIIDLVIFTTETQFYLHHIGCIVYILIHHELNDMILIIILILGEITNPILIWWRSLHDSYPKLHYDLTLFNIIFFGLVRVFLGMGVTFHSTWKYNLQSEVIYKPLNICNWLIFIGFNAGTFFWLYKLIRRYTKLTEKQKKKDSEEKFKEEFFQDLEKFKKELKENKKEIPEKSQPQAIKKVLEFQI